MAGDWIKMRADLQTHPKVVRIASALRADRFRIVGGLHAVWCLFDAHSVDGQLTGYTTDALDDLIGWSGFSGALVAVDWLVVGDGFLALPRFDEHNGQSAKRRATEAQRKRIERSEKRPQPVRKTSASDADKKRTREEKRREEEIEPNGSIPPYPPTLDIDAWKRWFDYRVQIRKPIKPASRSAAMKALADFGPDQAAVVEQSIANGWQGLFALKASTPQTVGGGAVINRQELIERHNRAVAERWAAKQQGDVIDAPQ